MKRFAINELDLFDNVESLVNKFVRQHSNSSNLEEIKLKLKPVFEEIVEAASTIDVTLEASARAEIFKMNQSLSSIEAKMIRSEKQRLETQVKQIRKLMEKLFPDAKMQERNNNFIQYYLLYGKEWFNTIFELIDPTKTNLIIVTENEY
jgi:uncharacterized protein YllA (UPF0747 family)